MPYPKNTVSSVQCRIQDDPDIRYFESGTCKIRLRVSEYQGKNKQTGKGEYMNLTLEVWGKTAEFFGKEEPKKGDDIAFTGSLVDGSYEKQDGTKVYQNVVNVSHITLLRKRGNGEDVPF